MKLNSLAAIAVLVSLHAISPAAAQNVTLNGDGSGAMEVDAENGIEWRQAEQAFVAKGSAVARRGDLSVAADELIARYRDEDGNTQVYRIEAEGNVVITSRTEQVTGDRAVYDLDQTVAVVTGRDLRLTTPTDLVTAESSLEFHEAKGFAIARGNAAATREDRTLRADLITARLARDRAGDLRVTRVDADGNVNITTATDVVRGEKGVYDVDRAVATLEGSVKITRGRNQLNGDYAEVNLETGISRLTTRPGSGTRVQGLFIPEPRPKPAQQ